METIDRNEEICLCMSVTYGEIADAIKSKGLKTVEEIGEVLGAGTGCGGCQPQLEEILKEVNG